MSIEALAFAKQRDLGDAESAQARLLIYVIAENTFNDSFVCRLCQEQLAYEAGRAGERTIRRHLDALEAARIIIRKRPRDENGNMLAHVIRLVGFKRWYRRDHDAPKKRYRAKSPPAKMAAGLPAKMAADHRPLLAGTIDNRTSKTLRSPPTPSSDQATDAPAEPRGVISNRSPQAVPPAVPAAANGPPTATPFPVGSLQRGSATTDRLLAALLADGEAVHVVEAFIAPLLATRAFKRDVVGEVARLALLRELRDGLSSHSRGWLEAALPRVRAARMTMPNLAEALYALGSGGDQPPTGTGVRSTVDTYDGPRTNWPSIVVRAGDLGWQAWLDEIGRRMGPATAEAAGRSGRIEAAARWPSDGLPDPKTTNGAAL